MTDQDGQTPPDDDGQTPPADDGQTPPDQDGQTPPDDDGQTPPADDDGKTYTAEYVAGLRTESAAYRTKLRAAEQLTEARETELWAHKVTALGVLADATDLPVNLALLDDDDALRAAATELVERKPHLRSRAIRERAGQGEGQGGDDTGVSLSAMLRRGA